MSKSYWIWSGSITKWPPQINNFGSTASYFTPVCLRTPTGTGNPISHPQGTLYWVPHPSIEQFDKFCLLDQMDPFWTPTTHQMWLTSFMPHSSLLENPHRYKKSDFSPRGGTILGCLPSYPTLQQLLCSGWKQTQLDRTEHKNGQFWYAQRTEQLQITA